jgi:hypothetical protein
LKSEGIPVFLSIPSIKIGRPYYKAVNHFENEKKGIDRAVSNPLIKTIECADDDDVIHIRGA